jgi:hypothetical protein
MTNRILVPERTPAEPTRPCFPRGKISRMSSRQRDRRPPRDRLAMNLRLELRKAHIVKRRHISHPTSFEDRLSHEVQRFEDQAKRLPPGQDRDELMQEVHQAESIGDKQVAETGITPKVKRPVGANRNDLRRLALCFLRLEQQRFQTKVQARERNAKAGATSTIAV